MKNKTEQIKKLKKDLNAVILAHNYQRPEIQDIADFCGDSLELSKKAAAATDVDIIVFCGVDFMAQTAKILSPSKKVLLPNLMASCPMAEMITAEELRTLKIKHPEASVVCYVNTTADVKAESDVCCTSSNAVKIVRSLKEDKIVFVPDKNLGSYVASQVDKEIVLWPGYCLVHDSISKQDIKRSRALYPNALVMAHPECRSEVLTASDSIVSTGQMFEEAQRAEADTFIVATEISMLHALKKRFPDKKFVAASEKAVCWNMKKITLDILYQSMKDQTGEISLSPEIISKASGSLDRMLELS